MKYLLAIYGNDEVWNSFPPEHLQQIIKETDAHNTSLFASGELIGAYGVADQMQAKKVRLADGATVVTDGPYIEAKEYLGSFYVVDCESLDRDRDRGGDAGRSLHRCRDSAAPARGRGGPLKR